MINATNSADDSSPPYVKPEPSVDHNHDYSFEAARRRLDVYPSDSNKYLQKIVDTDAFDIAVEGKSAFKSPLADQMIIDFLMSHGVSLNQAYTYVKLLWLANINLMFPVTIASLAKKTNRTRQTVREQIIALEKRGILEREYQKQGPMIWRFRTWDDLVQHLSGVSTDSDESEESQPERSSPSTGIPAT